MALYEAFLEALRAQVGEYSASAGDKADPCGAAACAPLALRFVEEHQEDVKKALSRFSVDGRIADGSPLPASAYNDYYKWTMLPVMHRTEAAHGNDVRCTFSVNVRDKGYRKALVDSATGKSGPELFEALRSTLSSLSSRPFDREVYAKAVQDTGLIGWDEAIIDDVCGPAGAPRMLAQEVHVDASCSSPMDPKEPGNVLVQAFVARDGQLDEERVFIEASGPWSRVTWLETSMMQAVYEALFRDRNRKNSGASKDASGNWDDSAWYPKWLAKAFIRCARSLVAVQQSKLRGGLMTGRRTGGMALIMLQGMYLQKNFKGAEGGPPAYLGTSSVTAHYWLKESGVSPELIPVPMGTHAHEMSMTLSSVFGELDDKVGMPLSQVVGHVAYFFCSKPKGDDVVAMPMLPDTLGSDVFMRTAQPLKVPHGPHAGKPLLGIFGSARQDSGTLEDFAKVCKEFAYEGAIMASEIEKSGDLFKAAENGYRLFGAGGFFGDSEKAWEVNGENISMAVKILRVYVGGKLQSYYPVKTGDDVTGSKFEVDGTLNGETLAAVKERTKKLKAFSQVPSDEERQRHFEEALAKLLGTA